MKVKTIVRYDTDDFNIEVNKFIQHKHIVDIKFNVCRDSNDYYAFSALIIYEEMGI